MSNLYSPPASNLAPFGDRESAGVPAPHWTHSLIWLALSGILIALFNASVMPSFIHGTEAQLWQKMWMFGFASVVAASATGLFVLFSARKTTGRVLRQPGHWFLFFTACGTLLYVVVPILARSSRGSGLPVATALSARRC